MSATGFEYAFAGLGRRGWLIGVRITLIIGAGKLLLSELPYDTMRWERHGRMRAKGFEGMVCSVADVMGAIGDRWGLLIMRDLLLGLRRYEDLRHSSGITNATLSDRLRALEQAGLVDRRKYQSRPDRFEYLPTKKGRDLSLLMQAMVQIGDSWKALESHEPPLRFVHSRTGHAVKLALVDAETGEQVTAAEVTSEPGSGADEQMRWRLARGNHVSPDGARGD